MEQLNEYDETKRTLDIVRGLRGKLIKEGDNIFDKPEDDSNDTNQETEPITDEPQDSGDAIKVDDVELREENEKLSSIVSSSKITAITVYPKTGSVVMVGTITNMNDAQFQFTYPETDGCFFTANSMRLTKENAKEIGQLQGHYKNWCDEWAKGKMTDYQNKANV